MVSSFEETLQAGRIDPRQQAAESMMSVGIGSLSGQGGPNYGNLPETFQGEGKVKWHPTPIHNLPFYPQKELHTINEDPQRGINPALKGFKWDQDSLYDLNEYQFPFGHPLYQNKPKGWFPEYSPRTTPYDKETDISHSLINMLDLRERGKMDFSGEMKDIWDDDLTSDNRINHSPHFEEAPQNMMTVSNLKNYLQSLSAEEVKGITGLLESSWKNSARENKLNKYWWQRSDI